ncbi:MAG TPA: carboxypeptidase-like regulatory domain-containing protein [Opitutaceae bacterium]|nr:carboxypeptidase-like regulatory domain-containing protein [Opitutaceae bacterium]
MKPMLCLSFFLLLSSLFGNEVRLRVVDETGAPVEGANAVISFLGVQQGQDDERKGLTDKDGRVSASGTTILSICVTAKKEGHYDARIYNLTRKRDIDQLIVLPRITKPIPLYALDFRVGSGLDGIRFQDRCEWLGYDLEAGDWVQPYGKGKTVDIRFRFKNAFLGYEVNVKDLAKEMVSSRRGYAARKEEWTEEKFKRDAGKWDAELEISFPGEKEGLCEEVERFLPYSALKMPHQAPADGYVPTWHYTANNYSPRTARENAGFFLRTRVKLDKDGNIVSANYAKIIGDFQIDAARGHLVFSYYFNPEPNDRNLEFDPKKNLFPASFPGANVNDP